MTSVRRPHTFTPRVVCITDHVVIVGGGLAGLFCALKLASQPVTVTTAAPLGEDGSSAWAQDRIAAAVDEGDTPEAHTQHTVATGSGIFDQAVARDSRGSHFRADYPTTGPAQAKRTFLNLAEARAIAHQVARTVAHPLAAAS